MCHHLTVVVSHMEMVVGGIGLTLGMQRTFLRNSLEVAYLDLVHQDLGGLWGSSQVVQGFLGEMSYRDFGVTCLSFF